MNITLNNIQWQQTTAETPVQFNAHISIKWIEPQMQKYYESRSCKCPQCFINAMTTVLAPIVRWVAYNHFHQHLIDCAIEFDMSAEEAAVLHPKYPDHIDILLPEPEHQRMDLKMRDEFFAQAAAKNVERLKSAQQKFSLN